MKVGTCQPLQRQLAALHRIIEGGSDSGDEYGENYKLIHSYVGVIFDIGTYTIMIKDVDNVLFLCSIIRRNRMNPTRINNIAGQDREVLINKKGFLIVT